MEKLELINTAQSDAYTVPTRVTLVVFKESGKYSPDGIKDSLVHREVNTGAGTGKCIIVVPEQAPWYKPAIIKS